MNRENLQMMADMLGEVVAGTWKGVPVDHKWKLGPVKLFPERVNSFDIDRWADVTDCGYSACAVGHACFDKRFIGQGLHMLDSTPFLKLPTGQVLEAWDGVTELFGINYETARRLFHETHYVGYIKYGVIPYRVKARVEELLATSESELYDKYPLIHTANELSRKRPDVNE